jgi:hypothetical protein
MTRPPIDPADLIAAHTAGAGEALAAAIERGDGPHVEAFPPRPVPPPTPRDELVGTLFDGFRRLRSNR